MFRVTSRNDVRSHKRSRPPPKIETNNIYVLTYEQLEKYNTDPAVNKRIIKLIMKGFRFIGAPDGTTVTKINSVNGKKVSVDLHNPTLSLGTRVVDFSTGPIQKI